MLLASKLAVSPVTPEGAQALARYREWAKVSDGFGASFLALHEASHAVTAVLLHAPLGFSEIVSRIRKDGLYAGYTEVEKTNTIVRHHHYKLAIIAAAPIVLNAQLRIPDGDRMIDDDQNNIDRIGAELKLIDGLFVPLGEFRSHVLQWTRGIVPENGNAIHETARQLDIKKRLLADEVRAIVERYPGPHLPAIVQAACGLATDEEAEQIFESYAGNARYRSALAKEMS